MFIIYDLVFLLFAFAYLPLYWFRKKFHRGFDRRLGILPKGLSLDRPIWIHAVSVGEAMAVKGLIAELQKLYPDKKIVISTVTPTGNKIAQSAARDKDFVTYLPLDLGLIVKNVIDRINPSLFILAETEIWPNLVAYLYRKQIPIIIINGRISDASFKGYSLIKFLLKSVLDKVNLFCVQTERDAERLSNLGVKENRIKVTGNMKFDSATYIKEVSREDTAKYKSLLGLTRRGRLVVAGSTHTGEEKIIFSVYRKLLIEFPDLRLLIAPRHPVRAKAVQKLILDEDFNAELVSGLEKKPQNAECKDVFILDTIGELLYFYAIADIVFMGGSLIRKGGHNILEPAIFSKPIIFGEHMFNFRDIAELFSVNQAAILVHDEDELSGVIRDLLTDYSKAQELGKNARSLVLKSQGATLKNLEFIKSYLA